jgi:hypothetical protein
MEAVIDLVGVIPHGHRVAAGAVPRALKEIFNIANKTTGAGYLNAELFSLMLPVM